MRAKLSLFLGTLLAAYMIAEEIYSSRYGGSITAPSSFGTQSFQFGSPCVWVDPWQSLEVTYRSTETDLDLFITDQCNTPSHNRMGHYPRRERMARWLLLRDQKESVIDHLSVHSSSAAGVWKPRFHLGWNYVGYEGRSQRMGSRPRFELKWAKKND